MLEYMRLVGSLFVVFFILLGGSSVIFGQAGFVTGSGASGTGASFSYTPPAGYNRVVVVAVSREYTGAVSTISTMTYAGTQNFVVGRTHTANNVRTEIRYITEAQIRAGGYCGGTIAITWASNVGLASEVYNVMTLNNVDQTTVVAGGAGVGVNSAAGTPVNFIQTGNMTGPGINDMIVYASSANTARTHAPNSVNYTERAEVTGTDHTLASATRPISVGAADNPRADWTTGVTAGLINVGVVFNGVATFDPTLTYTFYSRAGGGAWDLNTTWSLSETDASGAVPSGVWPRRSDHVVIKSGHTVTADALDDNRSCGITATSLALPNVGKGPGGLAVEFDNSATAAFYHTGNITVGGIFNMSGGANSIMTSGTTTVAPGGNFTAASNYYNIGYFEVQPSSTFTTVGNLIISGNSTSLINAAITITNDFGIDWTNATICGSGVASLSLGIGSAIVLTNGGTTAQMCSSFTVACPGGGCTGATFPASGTTVVITGNSGPAGIGNSTFNRLWLKANDLALANGARVTSWADASGNGFTAAANANPSLDVTIQPQFITSAQNGMPSVRFDGGDYLTLGAPAGLNLVGLTDPMTFFSVHNVGASATGTFLSKAINNPGDARHYQFQIDGVNRFTAFVGGSYNQGPTPTTGWAIGTFVVGTTAASLNSFVNDVAETTNGGVGSVTTTADVLIGARRGTTATTNANFGFALTGDVAEIIFYRATFNLAQRIIMHNYLSAKYNLAITPANNLYTGDATGYDFEVAGIGQASDGSNHSDAKGTGPVRMWNPAAMGNGEFLIWGHQGANYNQSVTGPSFVDNVIIKERLLRIWKVTETGDVGPVNISFDISALGGTVVGSNIRLLIDRVDGNFATNDVAPIEGSYSSNVVTFFGVDLQANDYFTLGNTSAVIPLPIELLSFKATPQVDAVNLEWSTLTERNNDFFTVERSSLGEEWESITTVKGAGTTSKKQSYAVLDERPLNGASYYRLRQTDFNGNFKYSNVRRVEFVAGVRLEVYPNPSSGTYTVTSSNDLTSADVKMLDVLGRSVPVSVTNNAQNAVVEPGEIPQGVYFLRVSTEHWSRTIRVVRD